MNLKFLIGGAVLLLAPMALAQDHPLSKDNTGLR